MTNIPHVLRDELLTQDNRATGEPIFIVQERRRIYGMDSDFSSEMTWVSDDGDEAEGETLELLKDGFRGRGLERHTGLGRITDTDGRVWLRTGYVDVWEFVTCCFTEKAAIAYLEANRHNLKSPRVYVASGYRNWEWIGIREYFKALP